MVWFLTESVDVRVVDLGAEQALGGDHGVVFGQEELQVEETTFVGGIGGTGDFDKEMSAVGLGRLSVDAHNYYKRQTTKY